MMKMLTKDVEVEKLSTVRFLPHRHQRDIEIFDNSCPFDQPHIVHMFTSRSTLLFQWIACLSITDLYVIFG